MLGGWKVVSYEVDLPDLVILVDSSRSMTLPSGKDESSRWQATVDLLTNENNRFLANLAKDYRLRLSSVGEQSSMLPNDMEGLTESLAARTPDAVESRLGDALSSAIQGQRGRSTAAIVLISDGVVTAGTTLQQAASEAVSSRLPVIAVRTGSTVPPPSVELLDLIAESTAMVGDQVRVMARVRWEGTDGKAITVRLRDVDSNAGADNAGAGQVLSEQTMGSGADAGTNSFMLTFNATEPGLRRLQVEVVPVNGETVIEDNYSETSVDVRDDSFRVLLVQGGPSYEFRFLKHLLERATNRDGSRALVELITVLQKGDPRYADQDRAARRLPPVDNATLEQLDLIILSDCDPNGLGSVLQARIVDLVTRGGTSLVVIAGPNHLPQDLAGTPLERILPVDPASVINPQVTQRPLSWSLSTLGMSVPSLQLDQPNSGWTDAPPFYWLARTKSVRPGGRILLEASINSTGEMAPVVISQLAGNGQVWLQLTDETFRLHGADPNGTLYERYWLQLVRSLAQRQQLVSGQEAKLDVLGERFPAGSLIPFQVQLGYEMAASANGTVEVTVNHSNGKEYAYNGKVNLSGSAYKGIIEGLEPGNYRAVLTRPLGSGDPQSDVFVVEENAKEMSERIVDLDALERLASITGGQVMDLDDAPAQLLDAVPPGRKLRIRSLDPMVVWNHWAICGLLFSLICTQWILRRRFGAV
jgi:hypothetical protein